MGNGTTFRLEVGRSPDGRLEGTLENVAASEQVPFSGTLELLKVIEDALARARERPNTQT